MELGKLAVLCEAQVITRNAQLSRDIETVYAGDKMSDLLNAASPNTMVVTNLTGSQLLRLAELMDVPAICLLSGALPPSELVEAAERQGTALLVSPAGMFETCGRLYPCLGNANRGER